MKFHLALALLAATPAFAQSASPSAAPAAQPTATSAPLTCTTGSVAKTYGGTAWNVHACSDGHSIAIEAAPGNKAAPCTFTMQYQSDGGYQAHGRCGGDKPTTQAAFNDIGNLDAGQVNALYAQAQPAAPQK